MKRILLIVLILLVAANGFAQTNTPTPTSTETDTPTSTPTATQTDTPTNTPTPTHTETQTPWPTFAPISTETPGGTYEPLIMREASDGSEFIDDPNSSDTLSIPGPAAVVGNLSLSANLAVTGTITGTTIEAQDGDGLKLLDQGGDYGMYIDDNGHVKINGSTANYALSIGSTDGSNHLSMLHDNTNAIFYTDDGYYYLTTLETDQPGFLVMQGNGTGIGRARFLDQDEAEWLDVYPYNGSAVIQTDGSSPAQLKLQNDASNDVYCFDNSAEGETRAWTISGFRTGDSKRTMSIAISSTANDTIDFTGLTYYRFDDVLYTGTIDTDEIMLGGNINTAGHKGMGLRITGGRGEIAAIDSGTAWLGVDIKALDLQFLQNGSNDLMSLTSTEINFNDVSNDVDFRVESNGNTHAIFVDAGNDKVGILDNAPGEELSVHGDITMDHGGATDRYCPVMEDAAENARPLIYSGTCADGTVDYSDDSYQTDFKSGCVPIVTLQGVDLDEDSGGGVDYWYMITLETSTVTGFTYKIYRYEGIVATNEYSQKTDQTANYTVHWQAMGWAN